MKTHLDYIPDSTDEEIIKQVLAGHTVWFERLIRRYNSDLYKIARWYGFNHQDSEDLTQDAHFTAYMQLEKLQQPQSYKTWISKILINNCIYKLTHGYFKYEAPKAINEGDSPVNQKDGKTNTEDIIGNRELSLILENSLQTIPVIYKVVFVLREVEGFNVSETSEILGISYTNVRVRLNRAKQLLKKEIGKHYSLKELFDLKAIYCDKIVRNVFERIKASEKYATNFSLE